MSNDRGSIFHFLDNPTYARKKSNSLKEDKMGYNYEISYLISL